MVHVEELADELVDGVLGLQLDVHRQEEGREEEDRARQRDQLGRALHSLFGEGNGIIESLKHPILCSKFL